MISFIQAASFSLTSDIPELQSLLPLYSEMPFTDFGNYHPGIVFRCQREKKPVIVFIVLQ